MDTIRDTRADALAMPRFDDGMVNASEPIRIMAQSLINEIMGAQADEARDNGSMRNGYRERRLATCVGAITLRIPKLRSGSCHPEDLLTRRSRTDRAVTAAAAEMAVSGASARKAEKVARRMGVERMSCIRQWQSRHFAE